MMDQYSQILLIFFILIILFPLVNILSTLYQRHFKDYTSETEFFLNTHNLTCIRSSYPNKDDWKDAPFQKPPLVSFQLGTIKVLGFMVSYSEVDYKILHCLDQDDRGVIVWREIRTTIFSRAKFCFKIIS